MKEHEVAARFCALSTEVARERFNHSEASDCFCDKRGGSGYFAGPFQFGEAVVEFIEAATRKALTEWKAKT